MSIDSDSAARPHPSLQDVLRDDVTLDEAEAALVDPIVTAGFDPLAVRREILATVPMRPRWSNTVARLVLLGLAAAAGTALMRSAVVPAYLAGLLVVSLVVTSLVTAQHDCSHRGLFRSRWANDALGTVAGSLTLMPYAGYHVFHIQHHVHTRDPEDSEGFFTVRSVADWVVYVLGASVSLRGSTVRWWWSAVRSRNRYTRRLGVLSGVVTLASVAVLVALAVVAPAWLLLGWLPVIALSSAFLGLTYLVDHFGCAYAPAPPTDTGRSIRSNPIARFLVWNNNFHAVHHLVPGVPTQYRPLAHEIFEPYLHHMDRSYVSFHRGVLSDIRRGDLAPLPPWVEG